MLRSLGGNDAINMLAIESPKTHVLPTQTVDKVDSANYTTGDVREQERRHRLFTKNKLKEFENMRDGAINRSIVRGGYIEKPRISLKANKTNIRDIGQPKIKGNRNEVITQKSNSFDILELNKAWKMKKVTTKKGVLKDGPGATFNPETYRVRQNNANQKDLFGNPIFPDKNKKLSVDEQTDSSNHVQLHKFQQDNDTGLLNRRLISSTRPKSAGQAMYATLDYDSDDSFYDDGDVEFVDLDDPLYAYEREFEESRARARMKGKPAETGSSGVVVKKELPANRIASYHGNTESKSKQTGCASGDGLGLNIGDVQSDYNDGYSILRPSTSRGRRRAKSEPEVETLTSRKHETFQKSKQIQTFDNCVHQQMGAENIYNYSVNRVLDKYTNLNVQKDNSTIFKGLPLRQEANVTRTPLPRKLKPILRRDKDKFDKNVSNINHNI